MITKTYLDGRLNQLEEKLKRKIEIKDDRQARELEEEITSLKNITELTEERVAENKDMLNNYMQEHNNFRTELEELKREIGNVKNIIEKNTGIKIKEEESDIIVSDI